MPIVEEYIVRKPFSYAGEDYEQGDVWEPGGFRHDNSLIEHRFVWRRARKPQNSGADHEALMQKTNKELRQMLKERDLPVYGAKSELVDRLLGRD